MSNLSNDNGRAFEYVCITVLNDEISKYRKCEIIKNSSLEASKSAYYAIDDKLKLNLSKSAYSVINKLFELEPLILEGNDSLNLNLQQDFKGEEGDVRDIVISRPSIHWEIGLSIKHNHFAVKHSRLSKTLDFSGKWFDRKCSGTYWEAVSSIFAYLDDSKKNEKKWSELEYKENDVYVPLLKAFIEEIKSQNNNNPLTPRRMVEYLLGEYDFYKIISIDSKRISQIQSFNMHGNLNKSLDNNKPSILVPLVNLPTKIISIDFKKDSKNTVELYMDNEWQFSFRIHNASTYVETSLKFDIQIIDMPSTINIFDCKW